MSTIVDEQVVQLEFNNANFEKNVKQSIDTVNKLKDSLQIGPKTQEAITNSIRNIDLSDLAYKVDAIADRFSTFGIVGMTAVQRITNAVIDLGLNIERKLVGVLGTAWNQIITGGTSRAANIEQATFQLKGIFGEAEEGQIKLQLAMTGTANQIKEITGLTEDLIVAENAANYAVADTAYGLDSAAKAASVLATSGVDVVRFQEELADESGRARTEMQVALRSISGTAAMANASYDDIARIYEKIAGGNRVMAEELNSLNAKGLNAAAVLADYLNKMGKTANATEADIRSMCSKGQIDFMTFARAMDEAYGEHAKDANSTFSGAFDNMRFALSKIGADFIAPMREDMIPVLNNVRMAINAVRASLTPFADAWKSTSHYVTDKLVERFSKLIGAGASDSEWKSSDQWTNAITNITNVVQLATDILQQFLNLVGSIVQPISAAWKEIFPSRGYSGFVEFLTKIKEFIANSVLSAESMSKLNRTAKGFFNIFKIALQVIKPVVSGIMQMVRSLGWLKDILVSSTVSFADRISDLANSNVVFDTVSRIIDKVANRFSNLSDSLRNVIPKIKQLASNFVDKFISIKNILAEKIKTPSLDSINISMDTIHDKVQKVEAFFKKFKDGVVLILGTIFTIVKQLGSKIVNTIKDIFKSIGDYFGDMPSYLKFEKMFDLTGTTSTIAIIGLIFKKIYDLKKNYAHLFDSNESLMKQLVDFVNGIKKAINDLPAIISNIKGLFKELKDGVRDIVNIQMFKALALALVAFVASIYVLSKIDSEKALDGIIMVAVIITYLRNLMKSMSTISWGSPNLIGARKAISSLVVLSFATLILAGAISKVAKAFGNSPIGAILGLVSVYVMLEILIRAMERVSKLFMKASLLEMNVGGIVAACFAMIELAVAVKVMAKAISTIAKAFGNNPVGAIFSLIAIYTVMELLMKVMKDFMKASLLGMNVNGIAKAGFAMMEIGAAVLLMAVAMKIISTAFDSEDPAPGVYALISVCALIKVMVAALQSLSESVGDSFKGSFNINAAATALVGVALALAIVGATIAGLSIAYGKNPIATVTAVGTVLLSLLAITAILESFKPEKAIANAFALIEVAIALSLIGKAITKLSTAFSSDPIAAVTSTGVIVGMLLAISIAMENMDPAKSQANAIAMLEFAGALYLIASAVSKIGSLGLGGALVGVGSLILLMGAFAGFAALVGHVPAISAGLMVISACVSAMGVAMLAAGAGFALFGIGLVNVAAGVAALAAAWAVSGPMIVQGIVGTLSAIAMAIPTVAMALAHGLLSFIEVLLDHTDTIVNLVKTIIVSVLNTMSEMVPQMAQILLALLMFGLDLVAANIGPLVDKLANVIVNLVTALGNRIPDILGAIESFLTPLFESLITLVSNLLSVAAEGIGYVFGSLIGGIIEGIGRALKGVSFMDFAHELSDFMWALEPFLNGLNGLNKDSMEAAMLLAGVITIITADAIVNGLASWITGGKSFEEFGKQLAAFGPYIKRYANSVKGIDVAAVEASACAATMCADFAKKIPNEGGLLAKIVGDNDIEAFGKKLAAFGPYLKDYADTVKDVDGDAVAASTCAALMLAMFAATIPNEGGLISKITGDNDIETFGQHLEKFGVHIANYAEEVKDIDTKAVETSVNAARMLTEFAATIPSNDASFGAAFAMGAIGSSDNGIAEFGEQLALFGSSIKDYYNHISEVNPSTITSVTQALIDLFAILGMVDNVSDNSIANLRNILESLALAGLDEYFDAIATGSADRMADAVATFARNINEAFNRESESIVNNAQFRGQDFATGYANGINSESSIDIVKNAAGDLGQAALDALCDSIGDPPGDPATETEPMGLSFDKGFDSGIEQNASLPVNAAAAMGTSVLNTLAANTAGSYDIGFNLVTNLNNGIKDASNNTRRKPILQHPGYYNPNAEDVKVDQLPDQLPAIGRAYDTILKYQNTATESATETSSAFEYLGDAVINYMRDITGESAGLTDVNATYNEMAEAAAAASRSTSGLGSSTSKTGKSAKKASSDVDALTKKINTLMEKYEKLWDTAKENASKNLFKSVEGQGNDFLDKIKDIMGQYEDIYAAAVEKTNGMDLFAEVKENEEAIAPETLIKRLEAQADQINEVNAIVSSLSTRITDENFREYISKMGVEDLKYLQSLYNADDSQLSRAEESYKQIIQANQSKIQNELTAGLSTILGEYTDITSYVATDISTQSFIANLQAQVDQLNLYNETVASLMSRIKDVNLRDAIAHMGVESLAELQSMNMMTDAQLDAYTAIYNKKIASEAVALKAELESELSAAMGQPINIDAFYEAYKLSMADLKSNIETDGTATETGRAAGTTLASGAAEGITNSSSAKEAGKTYTNDVADGMVDKDAIARVEANAKMIVDTIITTFTNAYDSIKEIGSNFVDRICAGIDVQRRGAGFTSTINDFIYAIDYALTANAYDDWIAIGVNITNGIATGISDSETVANLEQTAKTVAAKAVSAVRDELKIKSPSRVFMQIGRFMDEGLAIGLRDYSSVADEAAGDMALGTLSPVQEAIRQLSGMLDGSIEVNPVITPTLDLSQVNARSAALANMFNGREIAVQARNDAQRAEMIDQLSNIVAEQNSKPQSITFNQTNNSPKALNKTEIYRQTRNGFSQLVNAIS